MQSRYSMEGLTKVVRICGKNGFFNGEIFENSAIWMQYGPLGSLLRRNILREWLSSIINNTDVCMFPLEVQTLRNQPKQVEKLSSGTTNFLSDVFRNYLKFLPVVGNDVPFGFAAYGYSELDESIMCSDVLFSNSFLSKLEYKHWLCVAFFCPPKKSSDWFNYWSSYRFRWWRKFSSTPSKFSMSDVTETSAGNPQVSLMVEFPWAEESLETITLHDEEVFKKWYNGLELVRKFKKDISPAVVVCQSELDSAAFAYICNSFAEKWRDGEIKQLLQLHAKLAPYKVCISLNEDNSDDLVKLKEVAKHLEKELKKFKVAVFPYSDDLVKDNLSQFNRFDEMGIPFTIVLNKAALNSGIVGLRNRDTTLNEQVHITELPPKILKYLQMKSYGIDEC